MMFSTYFIYTRTENKTNVFITLIYTYFTGRTMVLESTQSLTEINTKNLRWGVKAAGAYG
jgi:hypothetical protein